MQSGPASVPTCFNCRRYWGDDAACQFCGQLYGLPAGIVISSAGKRCVAHLLDGVLAVATCGIGYLIWSLIIFGNGQTPGKQVMGMRVVSIATATRASWGTMFLREFLAKLAIGFFLGWLLFPYFWLLWDKNKQQLWDKMLDTVVVDDPSGLVGSASPSAQGYVQPQPSYQQYQLPQPGQRQPWEAARSQYDQADAYGQASGGYGQVEPTAPSPAMQPRGDGARVCRNCGHLNSGSRQSCKSCHARL